MATSSLDSNLRWHELFEAAKRETNWYIHEVDFEDVEEIFLVMERTAGRLWVY